VAVLPEKYFLRLMRQAGFQPAQKERDDGGIEETGRDEHPAD
jgi:hypothetical protein